MTLKMTSAQGEEIRQSMSAIVGKLVIVHRVKTNGNDLNNRHREANDNKSSVFSINCTSTRTIALKRLTTGY